MATISTIPVRYEPTDDLFADAAFVCGVLTTDHAASCHGLPVFVRDDGAVLGPADIGPCRQGLMVDPERFTLATKEYRDHEDSETLAADSVELGAPWTPERFEGRKYAPGALALLEAARAAGYPVCRY
jgi:hypothetical protein